LRSLAHGENWPSKPNDGWHRPGPERASEKRRPQRRELGPCEVPCHHTLGGVQAANYYRRGSFLNSVSAQSGFGFLAAVSAGASSRSSPLIHPSTIGDLIGSDSSQ
jgi:hypothetical protein